MASVDIRGTSPNAIVTGGAALADKYRVTWSQDGVSSLLPFQAVVVSLALREWLPSIGVVAVSDPSAVAGDVAVIYDVRPMSQWSGRTVAELLAALNQTPLFGSSTFLAIPQSVTVTALGKVDPSTPSNQLAADQSAARSAAQDATAARSLLDSFTSRLSGGIGLVALAAGLVLAAFVITQVRSK